MLVRQEQRRRNRRLHTNILSTHLVGSALKVGLRTESLQCTGRPGRQQDGFSWESPHGASYSVKARRARRKVESSIVPDSPLLELSKNPAPRANALTL